MIELELDMEDVEPLIKCVRRFGLVRTTTKDIECVKEVAKNSRDERKPAIKSSRCGFYGQEELLERGKERM